MAIYKKFQSTLIIISIFFAVFVFNTYAEQKKSSKISYSVHIKKTKDYKRLPTEFWEAFERDARLFKYAKSQVRSKKHLKDRIKQDIYMLKLRVQAYGFFEPNIDYVIFENAKGIEVLIVPNFGEKFIIKNIKISSRTQPLKTVLDSLKPIIGKSASYTTVQAAAYLLERNYQKNGYPNARVTKKVESINRETKTVTLYFELETGHFKVFGQNALGMKNSLKQKFIDNRITWKEGQPYDVSKVEQTSHNFLNTKIFSYVDIQCDTESSPNSVPVNINLVNDKQRMVEFGAGLSSSSIQRRNKQGFRFNNLDNSLKAAVVKGSWTHFNMFEGGEKLAVDAKITPTALLENEKEKHLESVLTVEMTQPDVLKTDNSAVYRLKVAKEPTYVYTKNSVGVETLYDVAIESSANIQTGLALELANVKDINTITDNQMVQSVGYITTGIPVYFLYNSYDNPLNPTSGFNIKVLELPQYASLKYKFNNSKKSSFINYLECRCAITQKIDDDARLVPAGWASFRQVSGLDFAMLPLDKRLYAGGVNSVRAYAEQLAGPMIGSTDEPTGGRCALEFGGELRINITKKLGVAPFWEAAKVSSKLCPSTSDTLYSGWGVGFRYNTPIGPIRADFAFPCRKRKNIDPSMQFILSLGQAF